MKCSLVVTQGTSQGKEIPIGKSEFLIGRDAQCNLRPASQHVSKRHCILRVRGEQIFVEDFKSTNGTFINEEQVHGERELHDGDHLKVGPLEFVMKMEGAQVEKPTHVEKEKQAPAPVKAPVVAKAPAPAPVPVKAPAKAPAPAPAKAPAPAAAAVAKAGQAAASGDVLDDEAIGHLLLSLTEDEKKSDSDSFATGSTLMQVLKPEEMEQLQNATEKIPYRPQTAKPATGTSSSAAKAILEKYRRRPKS